MKKESWLLTCEHASKRIPKSLVRRFSDIIKSDTFEEHEWYDPGALFFAKAAAENLHIPLFSGSCSRLVLDLNRSLTNKTLFSKVTSGLLREEKEKLLSKYWHRYRDDVTGWIENKVSREERVVHLSCHTFTPIFHGLKRDVAIGLLFDPQRAEEVRLTRLLKGELQRFFPLPIRFNQPYKGSSDGLTTSLRKRFSGQDYVGIEIELSQELFQGKYFDLWHHVWCPKFLNVLLDIIQRK